jgi:hypothetical protein
VLPHVQVRVATPHCDCIVDALVTWSDGCVALEVDGLAQRRHGPHGPNSEPGMAAQLRHHVLDKRGVQLVSVLLGGERHVESADDRWFGQELAGRLIAVGVPLRRLAETPFVAQHEDAILDVS